MQDKEIRTMEANATQAANFLKIMAHPERLLVLCQLTKGELSVSQLSERSLLSQSAFSQHLTVLRKHQLIQSRKESQQVFYSLKDPRIETLIANLQTVFCP